MLSLTDGEFAFVKTGRTLDLLDLIHSMIVLTRIDVLVNDFVTYGYTKSSIKKSKNALISTENQQMIIYFN